jgi:hypothetical protein
MGISQSNDMSHKPSGYDAEIYLNEALPNLEVHCSPNPTYDTTTFEYDLKEAGEITLRIYNDMGHKVDEPVKSYMEPGVYKVKWSPKDLNLRGGVYYARMGIGQDFRLLKLRYIK